MTNAERPSRLQLEVFGTSCVLSHLSWKFSFHIKLPGEMAFHSDATKHLRIVRNNWQRFSRGFYISLALQLICCFSWEPDSANGPQDGNRLFRLVLQKRLEDSSRSRHVEPPPWKKKAKDSIKTSSNVESHFVMWKCEICVVGFYKCACVDFQAVWVVGLIFSFMRL